MAWWWDDYDKRDHYRHYKPVAAFVADIPFTTARLQPIAAGAPCNGLIWEAEFDDLAAAQRALTFFAGDGAHERLLERQRPFFDEVRIEFYQNLEFA
jgi:hypothetical protein